MFHNADATVAIRKIFENRDYKNAFILCSKTINTKTEIVNSIAHELDGFIIGVSDQIGEHAPLGNVIAAAQVIRDVKADTIITIGGGSVIDLAKAAALCITENLYTREALLEQQSRVLEDYTDFQMSTKKKPRIRIIAVPTTLATAEWTYGATPKNEETSLKARFLYLNGGPQAIVYDPKIIAQTPSRLLLSTGIRGLDHSINTFCALHPHPLASPLAERASKIFIENLPGLRGATPSQDAINSCTLAASLCGLTQMATIHGFSHWMVHIIGPYANVGHSDVACVLMLAQSKWLQGFADKEHDAIAHAVGRAGEPLHAILDDLLHDLELPTCFEDLGITSAELDAMAPLAFDHPFATKYNLRTIETTDHVREILALGQRE